MTCRDLQKVDGQWGRAKGFDSFCPVGSPAFATGLDWRTLEVVCRVNGVERQRAKATDMHFSIPELVSFLSGIMTLEVGDLIATGTPAGTAPLQDGDVVEVEIPGVGILSNPVRLDGTNDRLQQTAPESPRLPAGGDPDYKAASPRSRGGCHRPWRRRQRYPPPAVAVESMTAALHNPALSKYGFQQGLPEFRQAASRWIERRFGFRFDPASEILPLIGSKEGLSHLPLTVIDPGDVAIVPEPGYQAYLGGALLAGAEPYIAPLRPEDGFLLQLDRLPRRFSAGPRLHS